MHITPEACAACYEMLRHFRPFKGWKLPHADEVEFRVVPWKKDFAEMSHYVRTDELIMIVSSHPDKHPVLDELTQSIAHEMVHFRQHRLKINIGHGKYFKRMANIICKELGWNPRAF